MFRQLYRRTAQDGTEYGSEELDPLLWWDTIYLLEADSHQKAIDVLDEFLSTHAESLIRDPLKRALFQRDIWAVFDWLDSQTKPYPARRRDLEIRLAQIIKRVALPKNEIASLPDNERPILFATTLADEAQTVITWKIKHSTWQTLEALWH